MIAFFRKDPNPVYGTGSLVSKNCVVTAAHNVYSKARVNLKDAERVEFVIDPHHKDTKKYKRIKAKEVRYCSNFPKADELILRRSSDYAIITLGEPI